MASRVNIRFVIVLSLVLAMVFVGVAGAFFYVKLRSGDRYVRLGDEALARGDIKAADKFYASAVAKEQNNVAWLTKWRDIRLKLVPERFSAYQDDYRMYVHGILRTLAATQRTNTAAHREYLDAILEQARVYYGSRESWQGLIDAAEASMVYYEPTPPPELRAYRGMAIAAMAEIAVEVKPDQLETGRKDLEAALAANPKDGDAAASLAAWHRAAADRARLDGNAEGFKTALAAASKVLADAVAADPDSPLTQVSKLGQDAAAAEAQIDKTRSADDVARARAAALDALRPRLKEVSDKLKSGDPARLTPALIGRFMGMALVIEPKDGLDMTKAVIDRAIAARPDDPDLMALRSQVTVMKGNLEQSIGELQAIIDLPTRPISLQGLRLYDLQRRAMFAQANAVLGMAATAKTEEEKKSQLERVAKHRQQLASQVAEQSPELMFIDGKTKLVQGDPRGAQRLLAEFIRTPGELRDQTTEAMLLMANIGMQTNEVGLALTNIRKVAQARPGSIDVLLMQATLEVANNNRAEGLAVYRQVLELDPDNKTAKDQSEILEAASGDGKLTDPVMQRLVEADRIQVGTKDKLGDDQAALALLEAGIEPSKADPRLMMSIARLKAATGDNAGAVKAIELGLSKHPEDQQLKVYHTQLTTSGSLEATLAAINASPGTALDKLVGSAQAYLSYGKKDESDAAYAEAARLAPEDARVVEWQFLRALAKNDFAEATRLSDIAIRTDADRADGDTFKARILVQQQNYREAATLLQKAVDRGNANQAVNRLLGATQLQLGRGTDAVESFRRALALNQGDVMTIKLLLNALIQLDQRPEALATARRFEPFARRDPEFVNLWLDLESSSGNPQLARQRREQFYATNPSDSNNAAALATLYIDAREWDKARALIDAVRKDHDSLRLVVVDARWYAERGRVAPPPPDEGPSARLVFVSYISKLLQGEAPMTSEPYLAFGQFMLQHNRPDLGVPAIKQAARYQDPKTRAVDIALGDIQLARGQFGEAEIIYRDVLDAGIPDPDLRLRKRLIEALVQQNKAAAVEAAFAALGDRADSDVELLCQHAQSARDSGDLRRAREFLDKAVTKFPEEPLPYLRRARLSMLSPNLTNDALADLGTAIKLRPNFWQAYRSRATVMLALGRPEDAMRDWKMAVDTNPSLDPLRLGLIDLYLAQGRETDAVETADTGLKGRAADSRFVVAVATRFSSAEPPRWQRATKYYRQLWELLQDVNTTGIYVNALLSATPPNLAEAEAVLATPALKTNDSAPLLMSRAALRRKQNKVDSAMSDAIASLGLCGPEPSAIAQWYGSMCDVFRTTRERAQILQAVRPIPAAAPWVQHYMARVMLDDAANRTQAISALKQMAGESPVPEIRVASANALAEMYAKDSKFDEAFAMTQKGLETSPGDAGLNNNAAYYLCENLNRPQDALKFGEKALSLAPGHHAIVETVASVHWKLGNKPKAIEYMNGALRLAPTEADKANWAMKLAGWYLESGDKANASAMVNRLREMIYDNPSLAQNIRSSFDKLAREVEQAP